MLVLCPECEVSVFFVGGGEEGSVSQAMRFLGYLGVCVQSVRLLGVSEAQEVRALGYPDI